MLSRGNSHPFLPEILIAASLSLLLFLTIGYSKDFQHSHSVMTDIQYCCHRYNHFENSLKISLELDCRTTFKKKKKLSQSFRP